MEENDDALVNKDAYMADVLLELKGSKARGVHKSLLFKKQIFNADDAEIKEQRFVELCFLQVRGSSPPCSNFVCFAIFRQSTSFGKSWKSIKHCIYRHMNLPAY